MLLKDPAFRPMPGKPTAGMIESSEGVLIRYALWRLQSVTGKGTVIILQGRSEYIEKHYELVSDLLDQGFDVLSFDWRGQGGSSRLLRNTEAGYVDDLDEYVQDLMTILQEIALPDCRPPFYLLGHSTGSLVALLAAPQLSTRITRMVLCSPFLGTGHQLVSQRVIKFTAGLLSAMGLGEVYLKGRFSEQAEWDEDSNIYTSSQRSYENNLTFAAQFPELCIGSPTAAWVYAACDAIERVKDRDFCTQIRIPILMLNASRDLIVDNRETEALCQRLRSGSVLTIKGARHEIWQEKEHIRDQFMAAFTAFVPGETL